MDDAVGNVGARREAVGEDGVQHAEGVLAGQAQDTPAGSLDDGGAVSQGGEAGVFV